MCSAVAAAERRAMWDLAFESLTAQSGLILSVVITVGALADIDVVRLLCVCGASVVGLIVGGLEREDDDGTEGGVSSPRGFAYDRPRLNDGGWYVTPNSGS